jgi:signal transduction histidine kinase
MTIRNKLLLGFGLIIAVVVIFGIGLVFEMSAMADGLAAIEAADDLVNGALDARRIEKNYLLFGDPEEHVHLMEQLDMLTTRAAGLRLRDTGALRQVREDITAYRSLAAALGNAVPGAAGKYIAEQVRLKGRDLLASTAAATAAERRAVAARIESSGKFLAAGLAAAVLVALAAALVIAKTIANPLVRLKEASHRIAMGDLSTDLVIKGRDEITDVAQSFESMRVILKNVRATLDETMQELQENQARLLQAEKLAAVGTFASGIAHELNNPLTSILTFSKLMLEGRHAEGDQHDMLTTMSQEALKARAIVKRILVFAKDAAIQPVPADINLMVYEAVDNLRLQGLPDGVEIGLALDPDMPELQLDRIQMGEVLANLLVNAMEAITPPGRVKIATSRSGDSALLEVEDTGAGIEPQHLHRIFDPFFSTKARGTGLGLAVSYDIIKKHGGSIDVTSTPGQGTTFRVSLPIHGNY